MTQRQFWLKLFSENKGALAIAVLLITRYATPEQIRDAKDIILLKERELEVEMPQSTVESVFGKGENNG